jgi:hypothetical protein
MIFHHVDANQHTYLLQDGDITYRFILTVPEPNDDAIDSPETDVASDGQQEGDEG